MVNRSNRVFLWTLLIIQILICAVTLLFVFMLTNRISDHTNKVLKQQALSISEDRMRERVENVILHIDHERENTLAEVKMLGEFTTHSLTHVSEDEMMRHLMDWTPKLAETEYGQALNILLEDTLAGTVTLFTDGGSEDVSAQFEETPPETLAADCPYYESVSYRGAVVHIFAEQKDLDEVTKSVMYEIIHASEYGTDGYVWVNEILNYEGGDDYAIRIIHPNLKDTEGRYLSTDEKDVAGGLPYQVELEGIRGNGEIFHTYYFQNKSDGRMAEKASYSKLYEPFNWSVATGDPLDSVFAYAADMEEYNRKVFSDALLNVIILLVIVFAADILLVIFSNRRHSKQVNRHMEEKLAENEQIFNIVAQHSDRTLCYYDISTRRARPWNEKDCETCEMPHMCFKEFSMEKLETGEHIMPDSREDARRMFKEIHEGVDFGETNINISMPDGSTRWIEFKYSGLFDEDMPVATLLSFKDITERHEHELVYQRHVQSLEFYANEHLLYIESDLTADRVEKLSGQMLPVKERSISCSHTELPAVLTRLKFAYVKEEEASRYFSCGTLLAQYEKGKRNLRSEWQVRFQDETLHWLDTEITLIDDPYNGNIKAFVRMADITEKYEEQQSVLRRADYDSMTGLLRRDIGENMIRRQLAARIEPGGILVALDLDDLKGINDTLGHAHGDKAITGIAAVLKNHFRKDDIIIRAGGDEFLVFLPGAGKSISSVELSLETLLRKLSAISVGDDHERTIHCSIGCAVELPETDTFDSLYQRADMALYHVKRSGKNNYAFFESAMLEDNYRFKVKQAQPVISDTSNERGMKYLLEVVAAHYPGVVLFNLTQNYFYILTVGSNVENVHAPDKVDMFWKNWRNNIHPDDYENVFAILSRNSLLAFHTQGRREVRHYYRNLESIGYIRTEVMVQFYTTDEGDVCAYLFFRWDTASNKDLEIQRLNKILELCGKQDFEYICLIDVKNNSYSTFSRDGQNSHMIPETADFDSVTKHIRDTQIPEEDREDYYEKAAFSRVLQHMAGPENSYSYRYVLTDGITREAVFNWYEDSHFELLMTVRKVNEA